MMEFFQMTITCRGQIALVSSNVEQHLGHCQVSFVKIFLPVLKYYIFKYKHFLHKKTSNSTLDFDYLFWLLELTPEE